jgi:hypothetical protein
MSKNKCILKINENENSKKLKEDVKDMSGEGKSSIIDYHEESKPSTDIEVSETLASQIVVVFDIFNFFGEAEYSSSRVGLFILLPEDVTLSFSGDV